MDSPSTYCNFSLSYRSYDIVNIVTKLPNLRGKLMDMTNYGKQPK